MNLKNSLEGVRELFPNPSYPPQTSAISSAVAFAFAINDCLSCVDGFMEMKRSAPAVGEWCIRATWKKAEVAKFKGEVQHHVVVIQMRLAELQL